ncbi:P-loop containing nucleoside triphosphate hydrolase protein [Mycena belliarum]|uniref:ATP-dependent DNA helicase n=1 Tax=Mycena belliarum TaxID=1033014 RepID=A0AAD6XHN0_9AGAR|nr:P-loop containing nucleoside triphosphate hydrolase protein [Mycena belliae]
MPTGAGKSICYQLPAVVQSETSNFSAVTVVVSPLVALIQDQVIRLTEIGVDAVGFVHGTNSKEIERRLRSHSKPALLYVTPEKVQKSSDLHKVLQFLYKGGYLRLFAIDETHCISTWRDFRSAYRELNTLRDEFPNVPIMALTATATPESTRDIIDRLKLDNPKIFRQSLNRPNIEYVVRPKRNAMDEVFQLIKTDHPNQSGIIYCTGRAECKGLAKFLRARRITAKHYHAKLSDTEKLSVHAEWKSGECKIIVATVSFGLGIDKPDVRFVIHYDLPKSLENYYQETGRAGRDGLPAKSILFYNFRELKTILDLPLQGKHVTLKSSADHRRNALAMVGYCEDRSACRRVLLLKHFGETFSRDDCSGCNNCSDEAFLVIQDHSKEAHLAVSLVQFFEGGFEDITVLQFIALFRGANTTDTRKNGRNRNPHYGVGKAMSQEMAELLFNELLRLDVLVEYRVARTEGHHYYLKVISLL